jgi:ParB-like chromosome segregation protein Spo0J
MMKGDQFGKFEADLKKHGLQNPVVLFEGKILDGRNRALVAHKLGWKIKTVKFEDLKTEKSALEYVLSANLHRRHLSDHERVQIAADSRKF